MARPKSSSLTFLLVGLRLADHVDHVAEQHGSRINLLDQRALDDLQQVDVEQALHALDGVHVDGDRPGAAGVIGELFMRSP
jgi:outer membrane cobalamin receptor